jgi:enoyl-CoA hydratase
MGAMTQPPDAPELLPERAGGVLTLTINRPERRNALSSGLIVALSEAVLEAQDDPEIRVIVITGTGDRAFCSGADLKEMADRDVEGVRMRNPMHRPFRTVFEVVAECEKPTIAAVNGPAAGGGFELAIACDLRVVSAEATFRLPEAGIGMGANFASAALPRVVPRGIALELLLTGRSMSAEEALRWGFATRVVAPDDVLDSARELAATIAAQAPLSVMRMKAIVARGADLPLSAALRLGPGADPYRSADRMEGVTARREGRPPRWEGR